MRNSKFKIQNSKLILLSTYYFLLTTVYVYAEEVSRVIARVNNEVITSKDLNDYRKIFSYHVFGSISNFSLDTAEAKEKILERLIEDKLILDEAKREKIEVSSSWVESKLASIISSYSSVEEFETSLIEKGLNITMLKEKIGEQYLAHAVLDRYVRSQITISPQEISRYYKDNLASFFSPRKFILWLAKLEDKESLENIAQMIKEEGFSAAKEKYGSFLIKVECGEDELKKEMSVVLEELKEGDCLIKEIDGFLHLIYLEKVVSSHFFSLEEAKEKIYTYLWNKKFKERFEEWLKELKKKAIIKIYLP